LISPEHNFRYVVIGKAKGGVPYRDSLSRIIEIAIEASHDKSIFRDNETKKFYKTILTHLGINIDASLEKIRSSFEETTNQKAWETRDHQPPLIVNKINKILSPENKSLPDKKLRDILTLAHEASKSSDHLFSRQSKKSEKFHATFYAKIAALLELDQQRLVHIDKMTIGTRNLK
jgi:hypothetical protein